MMMKKLFCIFWLQLVLLAIFSVPSAGQSNKSVLQIDLLYPGMVKAEGDIAAGDRIALYGREYKSAEHVITDKLLTETIADTAHSIMISYNYYAEPLSETRTTPDFSYQGGEIVINALYAVVSDGFSEIYSDLFYTDCTLDTGVVNQYWCSLAGSTACGTAAGVIAMQISFPSSGDDLFTRLNEMRKYGLLGADFSTGPSEYYLEGRHISNSVNKYITEELSGDLLLTDHRTAEKTTEETLIELLATGRPAVIEVCYLLGNVTRDFQGISHWITINGFSFGSDGYTFRFADSITVSYRPISSEMLDTSHANVSYGSSGYIPVRYIGAFERPLFTIE